ncbi:para-nitrobenzyl esterase [Caulobacter ginsengisoli]|uniref:Carboxylic ester hydrolase n=1 Tax=Caulobacter ginsengisoli TaxID=400775 RepID=A0ABU0IXY4_9CAUL|nr:carboxylesterase/lipase family protein [Caulobacter ginsengisoli]MDQ0466864.1 para-nitrobenzyl esterase [Caulobacter ginsengisoli]
MDRRSVLAGLGATTLATSAPAKPAAFPIAQTTAGKVRGYLDGPIKAFRGVRYGAPPRRFQPPAPPAPWTAIAEATAFGPGSPQRSDEANTAEDCLFLNLWTPGLDAARRPVMVYIHGGAYSNGSGSSPLYDGRRLAERGDVVVVTLNHRLNAFGHLYLRRLAPGFEDSGNAGMLDLVLALQWVRSNIAGFGGDPGKVMVFGQSGGGAKIATLMAMPAAAGLFHRAATMSGQQLTASGPGNATKRAQAMLARLGLTPQQAAEAPVEKLVEALATVDPIIGSGGLYMGPVLDERSLTRHPFYPDAPPQSAAIPMMIGNTHDETRGLIGRSDPSTFSLTWDDLPGRLGPQLRVDIDPDLVVATYRQIYPAYSPSDVFFAATTASRSWRAAVVEAELRAQQGSPAFAYQLDWGSPQDGGKWGAPHTLDIPLVFGTLDAPGSITGTAADARAVSQAMQDAFLAFARGGDPGWAPYSLPRRQTMVFNTVSALADDPRGAERRLFAKVPFIQQGT